MAVPGQGLEPTQVPTTPIVPVRSLLSLPAELVMDVVDLLPPEAFINFTFANYPLLASRGLAPALSAERVFYLSSQTQIIRHFRLLPIPCELILQVMSLLKPIDIMRFVMANYQDLTIQGIAPPLTPDTLRQLRTAVTRAGQNVSDRLEL